MRKEKKVIYVLSCEDSTVSEDIVKGVYKEFKKTLKKLQDCEKLSEVEGVLSSGNKKKR